MSGRVMLAGNRERDNLRASEIVLPGDCGHFGERLEKDAGRVGPSLTAPRDEKMTVTKLPLGRLFNEHGLNTLTHATALFESMIKRRFVGFGHIAGTLTSVSFLRLFNNLVTK